MHKNFAFVDSLLLELFAMFPSSFLTVGFCPEKEDIFC